MRYPVISTAKCSELAAHLREGRAPSIDAATEWSGSGDDLDLATVGAVAAQITASSREWTDPDRDRFEGKMAIELHDSLSELPIEVLDDRGFWRYLALKYFWDYIAWREEGPFAKGNHLKYVDAAAPTESVLTRMYLRAQAVGGSHYGPVAWAIPKSTDFWRSHVLRVRTGTAPLVTRAFASQQATERLPSDTLRQVARRLNRLWSNIVLNTYSDEEAGDLIEGLWPSPDDG